MLGDTAHAIQSPPETKVGTYLEDFFAGYSGFEWDSTQPIKTEFDRLCRFFGWNREDAARDEAYRGLQDAMVQTFNAIYGTDLNDLGSWHNLCRVVYIDPLPDDVQTCRDVSFLVFCLVRTSALVCFLAVGVYPSSVIRS